MAMATSACSGLEIGGKLGVYAVDEKQDSGLHLQTKRENPVWYGKVIAVGFAVKDIPVGSEVAFKSVATTDVRQDDGRKHLLVKEEEVYGVYDV